MLIFEQTFCIKISHKTQIFYSLNYYLNVVKILKIKIPNIYSMVQCRFKGLMRKIINLIVFVLLDEVFQVFICRIIFSKY